MRKLSTKSHELLFMAYSLKISCKPIMYIYFFELATFIGIKTFLEIYSDRSGDFYAGVMSHDPPQIQI